jgi:5-methylcytosine-specific restriction endonuclease McrA
MAAAGSHTTQDLRHIYNSQSGCCFYCGRGPIPRSEGHFDHVIPLARGGSNDPENIVFACELCNRVKHTRTPEEFAKFQRSQKTVDEA